MERDAIKARTEALKARAHNRWDSILGELLPNRGILNRKNQPCPKCEGGRDRFQYTDKFGNGDAFCRSCGHIDGFELLQCVNLWSFREATLEVERLLGTQLGSTRPRAGNRLKRMRGLAMKMWAEARPIARDDEVDRYLRARGLGMDAYPENLRCHPGLGYYEVDGSGKSTLLRNIPAMLALMQDASGEYVSLHRTYIEGGHKALVPNPKKCLTTFPNGAVIRLFESTDELALAEGIETALALHLAIGRPVWATYSATNMEHVAVPPSVHRVRIYADHDRNFVGQSAAFLLARRLMTENHGQDEREIRVFIPVSCGTDWADIWVARVNKEARAA